MYWIFFWYDTVVHSIGGVAIAFSILAIRKYNLYRWTFFATLACAVLWEAFEHVFVGVDWRTFDTLTDSFSAISAALLVVFLVLTSKLKEK